MASSQSDRQKFDDILTSLVLRGENFRITFSRQRYDNRDIKNAYLKTALIKNELSYSITYRYKTRDEVKNYSKEDILNKINQLLADDFMNAVLFTATTEITLLHSKKNKATIIQKNRIPESPPGNTHDEPKKHITDARSTWLQALGLAGQDGKILDKSQDKFRQINKYTEIIDHLLKDVKQETMLTIADMGSGKGYLTFALYDHLVNQRKLRIRMTGYDLREDLISFCYGVAAREGFVGLTFQQKGIDQVDVAGTDMVIALHACDIATDMAIAKGIQGGAGYIVVSPCCHKQVRQAMHHQNTLSPILRHGILEERMAEILTDGLRALIMEAKGYRTQVFEFISAEHTSKNLMITGVKGTPDPSAWVKAQAIMAEFGITNHYLADLMGMR